MSDPWWLGIWSGTETPAEMTPSSKGITTISKLPALAIVEATVPCHHFCVQMCFKLNKVLPSFLKKDPFNSHEFLF